MKICDKCKKELPPDYAQIQFPYFYITKAVFTFPYDEKIDLCPSCSKKLDKWLKEEPYYCIYDKKCVYRVKEIEKVN